MANNLTIAATVKAKDMLSQPVVQMAIKLRTKLAPAMQSVRRASALVGSGLNKAAGASKRLALAAVAALGGAGYALNAFTSKADELGKFARQVGVPVEALQELRYAAERSGVGAELFDKSLSGLSRRMGELKSGSGDLHTFLSKVSPAFLKQLKGTKNNEEAFEKLVLAIAKIEDPQRKAILASKAFGEEGAKLVRMAEGGAEGIRALREEARKYGVLTKEETDQAEAAADAMLNLKRSMIGIGNSIGAKVLPLLTPLMQRLAEWITKYRELIGLKVKAAITGISDALRAIPWARIMDAMMPFMKILGTMIERFRAMLPMMEGNIPLLADIGKTLADIVVPATTRTIGILSDLYELLNGPLHGAVQLFLAVMQIVGAVAVGVVLPAIGLLTGAFVTLKGWVADTWLGEFFRLADAGFAMLPEIVSKSLEWIGGRFSAFGTLILDLWARVTSTASIAWMDIKNGWNATFEWLFSLFEKVAPYLKMLGPDITIKQAPARNIKNDNPPNSTDPSKYVPIPGNQRPNYAPPIPSAMPQSSSPGWVANTFGGQLDINVKTDGPSVAVTKMKSSNKNVGMSANVGRRSFVHGGI